MSLAIIEKLAAKHARERNKLAEKIQALEAEIAAIKKKHLPGIKQAANASKQSHDELFEEIENSPQSFVSPKTVIFHGIKCGFRKKNGTLSFVNKQKTLELTKKLLPEQVALLIKTTESPIKRGYEQLDVKTLKKLGVNLTQDSDEVFIKSTDSEIDKMVEALIKDSETLEDAA